MCKFVGYNGKIAQYKFCEQWNQARERQNYWQERLEEAKFNLRIADNQVERLRKTHCPIEGPKPIGGEDK